MFEAAISWGEAVDRLSRNLDESILRKLPNARNVIAEWLVSALHQWANVQFQRSPEESQLIA